MSVQIAKLWKNNFRSKQLRSTSKNSEITKKFEKLQACNSFTIASFSAPKKIPKMFASN